MYVKRVGIIIFVFALSFFLSTVSQEAIGEEKPAKGEIVTNSLNMKFVLIPAGTFKMGSASDELGRGTDELLHKVTISKSFYLQTTEVTQRQWREIMDSNPSHFKACGNDCPVEKVSWDDTQKFILRLNEHDFSSTVERGSLAAKPHQSRIEFWKISERSATEILF